MNLYEIIDTKTGEVLSHSATSRETREILKATQGAIDNAYHSNYLLRKRYRIELADTTIAKRDTIWIEWDTTRKWFMNKCKEKT